jgi:hypothetical protein
MSLSSSTSSDSDTSPDNEIEFETSRKWIHSNIRQQADDGVMTFTNISIPALSNEQKFCDDVKPENDTDQQKRHQKVYELFK